MSLRLFSQVNADSDLIEAWLKYYLRLGVDSFHLVVHGRPEENERLLTIKDSYPITIEDRYEGPFPEPIRSAGKSDSTQKKKRLDILLARYTGQWVLLVDSDEFVEFPYQNIPETIRQLESAGANLMAAPMLQRLKNDGSLDSPPTIEDPFQIFPLCSVDLYRRMGIKAEIFKFPLFYCESGTELMEEGNHYPPLGADPRHTGIVGVTHHFKFRHCISARLEKRINSAHGWRQDSIGFREYLDSHANRLPLEGTFPYSREELFRRKLLTQLPASTPRCGKPAVPSPVERQESSFVESTIETKAPPKNGQPQSLPRTAGKKVLFVLPKVGDVGGAERHLLDLLSRLPEQLQPPIVICFEQDFIGAHSDRNEREPIVVKHVNEPQSLLGWLRIIRADKPDSIVFLRSSGAPFSWRGPFAAALVGVRTRVSLQHSIPPLPPPPGHVQSARDQLRRLIGRRARRLLKTKISAGICDFLSTTTVCPSNAVRDALVKIHRFQPCKTVVIHNGVSNSTFAPSESNKKAVRQRLEIDSGEFLLVCVAKLVAENGVDILIRAVSKVLRQGVPCKCIILGDGPLREALERKVSREGVWDNVFFQGFQQDVRPYLQAASAFILTSHLEGSSISILEAMACGLPCIVTNTGGSAEAIEDQVTGLVIPPSSPEAAADAILHLATNPGKCGAMAKKAREVVSQSFDIKTQVCELMSVIAR